tara:strand:+ start:107 stop:2131 length:2025 start_codon:yes stop_codon:yes gene_type:complete
MKNIFQELKNRKVFRSAAIYGGTSFIILQVCSIIFPALLLPDWSMRLLVVLLLVGFPVIIIFSWVYDLTDKGVVKTVSKEQYNNKFIFYFLFIFVSFVLFYFFKDIFFQPAVNPKSIAVIPFDNYSQNSEDEYLSDGFTEVIIANLAKVKDLMVISRTSVMRYKKTTMSLKDIAKELNVAHILEGSVQRTGNKIRVVGQLIEASTDKHVWAETYDEEFDNIFSIQTSIATEIAAALKSEITANEKAIIKEKYTDNIKAYEMFLKVRELNKTKTDFYENKKIRREILQKIIEIDPQFSEAYAEISFEHSNDVQFGHSKDIEASKQISLNYITKAMELDSESVEVRAAYGWYYYVYFRDYLRALEHYEFALSKEPGNAGTNGLIGFAYRRLGKEKECIQYLEEAYKLDPNNLLYLKELNGTYFFYKKYNKIDLVKFDEDYYRIDPADGGLYSYRAFASFWMDGNTKKAREIIKEASLLFTEFPYYSTITWDLDIYDQNYEPVLEFYIKQGEWISYNQRYILTNFHPLSIIYWLMNNKDKQKEVAEKGLKKMFENKLEGESRYHNSLAYLYAFLGEKEKAISQVKMAISLSPPSKDIMIADFFKADLAIIYGIIGEYEKSLNIIEELLSGPSNYSWTDIKYDRILFNIFKDNSRFKSLVAKDEEHFRKEITFDRSIY